MLSGDYTKYAYIADLKFGKVLGQGGFGTVFPGEWVSKGIYFFFVKCIVLCWLLFMIHNESLNPTQKVIRSFAAFVRAYTTVTQSSIKNSICLSSDGSVQRSH